MMVSRAFFSRFQWKRDLNGFTFIILIARNKSAILDYVIMNDKIDKK